MPEYVYKPFSEVTALAHDVLTAMGADDENAAVVAEHLALADASGMYTHGIVHLPGYLNAVRLGGILPTGRPRLEQDAPAYALVHGGWTYGQVGALYAIDVAIEKARNAGIAMVGLVGAHHIGRVGHFAERAADNGCTALVWAGGYSEEEPQTAAFGGQERVLGTNPIAFGFPGGQTPALGFDFATTTVSGMRLVQIRRRGEQLPPGSIVGPGGVPSTDPDDFFRGGAHLPFGGHKGYALSLAAEWLGRVFLGSDRFADPGMGSAAMGHQGVLFMVARADAFAPEKVVRDVADDMYRRIGSSEPAPGVDRVLLPGQLEAEARQRSTADGVRFDRAIWDEVAAMPRGNGDA
jgi:LDH2 family malate/lactate/ureidoglycolate dehydrogenase